MITRTPKNYSNEQVYSIAGITRQGYAKRVKTIEKFHLLKDEILTKVKEKRKTHRNMGSRTLYHALKIKEVGVTKFEQIMSSSGMTIIKPKKRIITTQSGMGQKLPNLTNGLILNDLSQLIVGDITYYKVGEIVYYIFILKDFYSKRIVGIYGNTNMCAINGRKTLNQFFKLRGKQEYPKMIHHTDGGSQYKANIYRAPLQKAKVKISMAHNCLENGSAEQINGVAKNDYICFQKIKNVTDLNKSLMEFKRLYNEERPVKDLKYKTPVEFEKYLQNLPIGQRPLMKLHDFIENRAQRGSFF